MLGALKRLLPSRLCPLDRTISSASRAILFQHLTRKTEERIDASSSKSYKARIFDKVRSERLHWIKHHIDERSPNLIEVFTLTERRDGKDATRTYIYMIPLRRMSSFWSIREKEGITSLQLTISQRCMQKTT